MKILFSTALTVFAFMFDRVYGTEKALLAQFAGNGSFANSSWCFLALAILVFYWKSWGQYKDFQKIEAVFSVIFAILVLIGKTFSAYDSLRMLETQKLMTLFAGVGWCIFFYMLLRWLTYFMGSIDIDVREKECKNQIRFQTIVFLLILICWLPQLTFSMPGNVSSDGTYQLTQWFGYRELTAHHPCFSTAIFGLLMSIGRVISDNTGILLIVLFQIIFCSWAYSKVCLVVDKYAGRKAAYLAALFFSIVPMWGSFAVTIVKDTLFYPIFALYFCNFINIFDCDGIVTKKNWAVFWFLSLLVCLLRNDGIYRVLPAGMALLLALKHGRKQLLYVLSGICIFMFAYNTVIFDIMGIPKGPIREMLSIPFQQTARYSRDHGKDISKVEKEIINKILPYDELAKAYSPWHSDPVKNKMKKAGKGDLKKYFRVWFNMGLRHPGTYLQAIINNTYGYYYPFRRPMVTYYMYTTDINRRPIDKWFNVYYTVDSKKHDALVNYDNLWCVLPGVSLLSNPGAYTWIVIICIMVLLKIRKYRQLAVISILLLQIAVCCASPASGLLRLSMPLMACTPVLLAWLWHILKGRGMAK